MLIETMVAVFYGYAGLGAVFGLYFVTRGAARIDADAHHLSPLVRLLLWPASVALWPFLLAKIVRSKSQHNVVSTTTDVHSAQPNTP